MKRDRGGPDPRVFCHHCGKNNDWRAFRIGAAKRIHERALAEKQRAAVASSKELVLIGACLAKKMLDSMQFESKHEANLNVRGDEYAYTSGYFAAGKLDLNPRKKIDV